MTVNPIPHMAPQAATTPDYPFRPQIPPLFAHICYGLRWFAKRPKSCKLLIGNDFDAFWRARAERLLTARSKVRALVGELFVSVAKLSDTPVNTKPRKRKRPGFLRKCLYTNVLRHSDHFRRALSRSQPRPEIGRPVRTPKKTLELSFG